MAFGARDYWGGVMLMDKGTQFNLGVQQIESRGEEY